MGGRGWAHLSPSRPLPLPPAQFRPDELLHCLFVQTAAAHGKKHKHGDENGKMFGSIKIQPEFNHQFLLNATAAQPPTPPPPPYRNRKGSRR